MLIGSIALFFAAILFVGFLLLPSLAMAQLTTTPITSSPPPSLTSPTTTSPLSLTPQEQVQQNRLQNITAAIAQSLAQGQREIAGVVFTPRWSDPVWIEPGSSSVLFAYCLPGELAYGLPGDIANPVQGILGGSELVLLDSYAAALTPDLMMWFMIVQNQDVQNRLPAAAGVICASDINDAQSRIISPVEQEEVNNIIQQFVTLQNRPGAININQVIDRINNNNVRNQNTTTGATAGGGTPTPGPECPPGYTFNPETDQCEQTVTGPASCATGFTFNPDTDLCERAPTCGPGFTYNPATDQCEAPGVNPGPASCATGFTFNPDTDLCERAPTCGPGFTYNPATDQCEQINTQAVKCPAGTTFNPATDQCERTVTQAPTTPSQPGGADTTRLTLTVPNDMVLQTNGPTALLVYSVTAQDDIDGTATLDEDNQLIQGDNVGGNIFISCRPSSQYFLPVDSRLVQCFAADAVNNTAQASFIVTVRNTTSPAGPTDTIAPSLSVPVTRVIPTTSPTGQERVLYDVSATDDIDGTARLDANNILIQEDNVRGSVAISCNPSSNTNFGLGNHTVECRAIDAAGNRGTASFIVAVTNTTANTPPGGSSSGGVGGITISDLHIDFLSASGPVASDTNTYNGSCPVGASISGTITDNIGNRDVTYQLIMNDGVLPEGLRHFDQPGSEIVSFGIQTLGGFNNVQSYHGWFTIEILQPVQLQSQRVDFDVVCRTPSTEGAPPALQTLQAENATTDEEGAGEAGEGPPAATEEQGPPADEGAGGGGGGEGGDTDDDGGEPPATTDGGGESPPEAGEEEEEEPPPGDETEGE
jgi:nitrate reductase NapAB chaperone NapD